MNTDTLIIIDPGHGGSETGAVANGLVEKDMNLKTSLILEQKVKLYFKNVIMTRYTDRHFDITARASYVGQEAAKFNGKTICLSVHFNAHNGTSRGAETIHSIFAKPDFAKILVDKICELGIPLRRVFSRRGTSNPNLDYYAMHRHSGRAQTVILEPLFIDSKADVAFVKDGFYENLAQKYLEGLLKYLNIEEKQAETKVAEVRKAESWKYEGIDGLADEGLLNDRDGWAKKVDEDMPVWATMLILKRIYEKLKG